jgi:5-methylthioadenosine/S-adenosylhomocysteine deaminase
MSRLSRRLRIDGARAVGLEAEIGSIEVGKKADIVVLDYNNAFMTPIHHPVSAIVYSALGHEVTSVLIDGRFVMRDGIVGSVDEVPVRRQALIRSSASRGHDKAWRDLRFLFTLQSLE